MQPFHYSALTRDGALVQGELLADDAAAVIAHLHQQQLVPISATDGALQRKWPTRFVFQPTGPLPGSSLAMISQQLARLLKAGLPLDRALAILVELSEGRRLKQTLQAALDRVRDGTGLAEAMAREGRAFPEAFLALVRAGELSGALQGVLAETATFLTRSDAMRQKVTSAMVYPAILIIVAALSVGVILTAVLPQFEPMFKEAGAKLPLSTQIVVAVGDALRADWWLLLIFAVLAGLGGRAIIRSPTGRAARDRLVLRLPLLRHLIVRFEVGRFCRTLGVMLSNGVAAPAALTLAGSTMSNSVLAHAAEDAAVRFRDGEGLSSPLSRSGHFPSMAIQLIRIGEETGRLDEMLTETAALFDQDVQRLLERLLSALVPALTLAMGLLIAVIVGAVMMALMAVNALAI